MNNKVTVVAINGPSKTGKDTLANALRPKLGGKQCFVKDKMALPIIYAMRDQFFPSVDEEDWLHMIESKKDLPLHGPGSPTMREAMIAYSERYMKPLFGDDIFAKLACQRIDEIASFGFKHVAISDSGFNLEYQYLRNHCIEKGYNLILVRCLRMGHTFSGDSREYVEPLEGDTYTLWSNTGYRDSVEWASKSLADHILDGEPLAKFL